MALLKKAIKESPYLKDCKVIKCEDAQNITIANEYATIKFLIHGINQCWLSFTINGTLTSSYCEELVSIMKDLEGHKQNA